jgi:transposase
MSTRLVVPPNITIIALPPKSPELNPVENIWQTVCSLSVRSDRLLLRLLQYPQTSFEP